MIYKYKDLKAGRFQLFSFDHSQSGNSLFGARQCFTFSHKLRSSAPLVERGRRDRRPFMEWVLSRLSMPASRENRESAKAPYAAE